MQCRQIGNLAELLQHIPLPTPPYNFTNNSNNVNVISFGLLAKEVRICYYSAVDDEFYAYKEDGGYIFRKCPRILMYRLDVNEGDEAKVLKTLANLVIVKDQEKHFFNLVCNRAKSARNLQNVIMGPSDKKLLYAVENNIIGYNTLRRKHINNTKDIFRPSESILKAKTIQKRSKMIHKD